MKSESGERDAENLSARRLSSGSPVTMMARSALAELKNKFNRSAASSDIAINRKVNYKCEKCKKGFRFITQLKDHTISCGKAQS